MGWDNGINVWIWICVCTYACVSFIYLDCHDFDKLMGTRLPCAFIFMPFGHFSGSGFPENDMILSFCVPETKVFFAFCVFWPPLDFLRVCVCVVLQKRKTNNEGWRMFVIILTILA